MRPLLVSLFALTLAAASLTMAAPARAQSISTPAPSAQMPIPPIVWDLREFPGVGQINEPGRYTVQFLDDGQISIHADCNWVAGLWTASDGALDITITRTTLAACPEDSLEQPLVLGLDNATSYLVDGFTLTIGGPSGEMRFVPSMPAVA
jgi:heat shock protein HslJ